jgi:NitT/TauT family transport system substrate-binding protein
MNAMLADKPAAIASLQKRDPMLDAKIEADRLEMMIAMALRTPTVEKFGVSHVDPARMQRALEIVAGAFSIPVPRVADIHTDAYLPPPADRMLKF